MSLSKIWAFPVQPYRGQFDDIVNSGMGGYKSFDHSQARNLIVARGPGIVILQRPTLDDDYLRFATEHPDPEEAADYWVEIAWNQMVQVPEAYWESFNEMSSWPHIGHFGEFEAHRQRFMDERGRQRLGRPLKAAYGGFATGCPPMTSDSDFPNALRDFSPAFAAGHKFKNIYVKHEYCGLVMSHWYGPNQTAYYKQGKWDVFPDTSLDQEGWLVGRIRKDWNQIIAPGGWTDNRVVVAEAGWDNAGTSDAMLFTGGEPIGAVKDLIERRLWERMPFFRFDPHQFAFEQIRWLDFVYRATPYVLGATMFAWGTTDKVWDRFNIEGGIGNRVLEHITLSKHPEDYEAVEPTQGLFLRTKIGRFAKGVLYPNEIVQVLEVDGLWSRVKRESGMIGWVRDMYLAPAN